LQNRMSVELYNEIKSSGWNQITDITVEERLGNFIVINNTY
jgi:hypothetical protein